MSTDSVSRKLALILPLLGSDKPGEVLAAVDALRRVLESTGRGFNDLVEILGSGSTCQCSLSEPCVSYPETENPSTYPEPWTPPREGMVESEYDPWAGMWNGQ
jgi:hypothetical protein